jgi:hypothetical protein
MISFRIFTLKHPAVQMYYEELRENFLSSSYFKGSLDYIETPEGEGTYEATFTMEKYIPFLFVVVSSLGVIGSLYMYLTHMLYALSWVIGIPAVIALASYWIFQSTPFYYFVVYKGLRKNGYKGVVKMRFS